MKYIIKTLFTSVLLILFIFILSVHFVALPYYVLLGRMLLEKKGINIFNYEVEDPFTAYLYKRVTKTFNNFDLDKKFYEDEEDSKDYLLNAYYSILRYKMLIKQEKKIDNNFMNEFYDLAKGTDYEVNVITAKTYWLELDGKYEEAIELVEKFIENTDNLFCIRSAHISAVNLYVSSNKIENGIRFVENVMKKHNITYNNEGQDLNHKNRILKFYIYLLYKNGEIERAERSFKRFEKEIVEKFEKEHNRKYSIRNSQFYIALQEAFG